MATYISHKTHNSTTTCSVEGCNKPADFEVALYDKYPSGDEFYEQDLTCPFICQLHHDENEARAEGTKKPRGFVKYPFTNRHEAQGYTKYIPIGKAL